MSSKPEEAGTTSKAGRPLVPKLRFPEFRDAGEWENYQLCDISDRVIEKVGEKSLVTASITAGTGFVSQEEKFHRNISGEQYKNYIVLNEGDFSYNKGNSKKYPQGCICKLKGFEKVAVPNAFVSFRFRKGFVGDFYQGYFEQNFHGAQLARFITSGARSDGLLNISPLEFFSIQLPTPNAIAEQQKIADCLSSVDDLIALEAQKLDALKAHKKGLMQQLFPAEGETLPNLRFPEFRDAGEWETLPMRKLLSRDPEYGVNAPSSPYSEDKLTYLRITDIDDDGNFLSNSKVSVDINPVDGNFLKKGDIVLARTGASVGKSYRYKDKDGPLVFAGFLIRIRPESTKAVSAFLSNFLTTQQYWSWVGVTSTRSGQPGINGTEYASLPVPVPPAIAEQQKIADCLSSLDDLIALETQKLDALKTHKKGLMQQLFPVSDEVPA